MASVSGAKTEIDWDVESGRGAYLEPTEHSRPYFKSRGATVFEVFVVTALALALLVPGIWRHSLVDPWETHYAEVARRMLQDDDLVHTKWQNEGFRSKPVLTFWLIASGLRSTGHAIDGGFSGEMVSSESVLFAVRIPFVLFGVFGLVMLWLMMARLVSRRMAWLAFLVVGTTPFYFFIARQAITDMPMVGCLMGSISCFALAIHSGERKLRALVWKINAYHVFLAALFLLVGWQIIYYAVSFSSNPRLGHGVRVANPHILLPLAMSIALAVFVFWHEIFKLAIMPVAALVGLGVGLGVGMAASVALKVAFVGVGLAIGVAVGAVIIAAFIFLAGLKHGGWTWWWEKPRCARQVYMFWFYLLVGISVLGKGLPALGVVGIVCFFYLLLTGEWKLLGKLEIPRGILLVAMIAVPWHVAMWMRDGRRFIHEYFVIHLWKRATSGVHGDRGTFNYFMSQIGIGMWPWIALVPAAVAGVLTKVDPRTREGRVRLLIGAWAITAVAFFSAVQTKFHHYIFPAIPALGILVAFWLDDLLSGKVGRIGLACVTGAGIVLLLMRDFMGEQKQLIELFIYRYDRPWPERAPWSIDLSDTILMFGMLFVVALLIMPRLRKAGIAMFGAFAVLWAYWAMNTYMGHAAKHWGMRDAVRTYYQQRQIYGVDIAYHGRRQLANAWGSFYNKYRKDAKGPDDYVGEFPVASFIPDEFAPGLPMTIGLQVRAARNPGAILEEVKMTGRVKRYTRDKFWIEIRARELDKIKPIIARGSRHKASNRKPWVHVNADRLIAWQLYWRGENFWSGDEIYGKFDDTKTAFKQTDNKAFLKYLKREGNNGRRFFIITESGRARGFVNILPSGRGKATFRILDTSSNKFTLLTFTL